MRSAELPRKIGPQPMDRQPPSADKRMITVRLPRRVWAKALIRIAHFFTIMDKLVEQLEREGDKLYITDVRRLAGQLLDGSDPGIAARGRSAASCGANRDGLVGSSFCTM